MSITPHLKRQNLSKRKLFTLALALSLAITMCGCLPQLNADFQQGIRVKAFEALATIGGVSLFPLPQVPNRGRLLIRRTDLSLGTESTFMGVTNAAGISDYLNVITDAQWSVGVGPSASPPCLPNAFIEEVPIQGAEFFYYCQV